MMRYHRSAKLEQTWHFIQRIKTVCQYSVKERIITTNYTQLSLHHGFPKRPFHLSGRPGSSKLIPGQCEITNAAKQRYFHHDLHLARSSPLTPDSPPPLSFNGNKCVERSETRGILDLLEDETKHPVGSMTQASIKEAVDAVNFWVSAAASIPRRNKHQRNRSEYPDKYKKEYYMCFDNARFLINRLAQEQNYHLERKPMLTSYDKTTHHSNPFTDDFIVDSDEFLDSFLLNRVVDCWRIGWRDGRLDYTPNELMAWVEDLNHSNGLHLSDNRTFTMIVDGICLRGDQYEAPLLAQWLLDRRLGEAYADEDDESLRPDTIFLTNVIRAWAKSGRIEAPEMADGLLKMMHELYWKSGWKESGPNVFSYSATMEAWSRTQHPDSVKRIEELLEEMKDSNLVQVVPDRVSYQYLLNALASTKSPARGEKAYDVLQEMIALFEGGNLLVAPNSSNFSRVMMMLTHDGKHEMVEKLLRQLQGLYAKTGDQSFKPTDACWKACIISKAKKGKASEAQGMLDKLVERALMSDNDTQMPSRSYFVDVLIASTNIEDPSIGAIMSQNILDGMITLAAKNNSYRNLYPDAKTFEKVILAWSRSQHRAAPEKIEKLIQEMENSFHSGNQKIRTSLEAYTNLMLAWQRSGRDESKDYIRKIYESLKLRCTIRDFNHLRPDKYVFGILLDTYAQGTEFPIVESIFQEMMKEWKNGNVMARPDTLIYHKILRISSRLNGPSPCPVAKSEYYFSMMKESGEKMTVFAYCCVINAINKKRNRSHADADRGRFLLEELLQNVEQGSICLPRTYGEYRQFLRTIAKSCIPKRKHQAKRMLKSLPRKMNLNKRHPPRELLPPL